MRNLHQILSNMSKPKQLAEVAEPKPEDEKRFKDKHVVDVKPDAAGNDDRLYKGKVRKKDKSRPADYQDSEDEKVYEDTEESGRGRYKVNYVHPDKKNIGNDRFESKGEAKKFADSLKKKGYHDVNITEGKEDLEEKKIKAPKNVLINDLEYALDLYMKGEASLKDLKDTANGDLSKVAKKSDVEKLLKNPTLLRMKAFESDVSDNVIKKQATDLLNALTEDLDESKKLIHREKDGNKEVKVYYDSDDKEYCAKLFNNGKHYEPADHFTDDKQDAIGTAKLMIKEDLDEKSLSPEEEKKKENIVKGMKKDKDSLKNKYGDDWKSVMYATATKRAQESMSESVEVSHERYEKEHGKKASGRTGAWMFTNKRTGNIDRGDDSEVFQPMNAVSKSFVDAAKEAKDWAKKHGHRKIYVMESVGDLGEDDHMPEVRDLRKKGYSVYVSRPNTSTPERLYEIEYGDKELDIVKQADGSFTKKGSSKKYKSLKDAVKGEMKEDLGESKEVYYNSYTDAIKAAMETVKKRGFEVDEDEYFSKISTGQRKPSEGKTVTKSLSLQKNGKPVRKTLEIQVYNKGGSKPFELNHYIGESVDVQENYPMTTYQEDSDVEDAYDLDREVLAAVISAAAFKLDWIDSVIEDEEVKLSVSLKDNVLSMKHLVDELFNRVRNMREAEPEVSEGVEVLESKYSLIESQNYQKKYNDTLNMIKGIKDSLKNKSLSDADKKWAERKITSLEYRLNDLKKKDSSIKEEITDEDLDLLEEYISELSENNQKKAKELAKTEQGIKKLLDFVKKQEEDDE